MAAWPDTDHEDTSNVAYTSGLSPRSRWQAAEQRKLPTMRVLTTSQMRDAESRAATEAGLSAAVLMENAGREVVAAMERHLPRLAEQRVAVLCGRGNNGGDGFVAARVLAEGGVRTQVYLAAPGSAVRGDAAVNLAALSAVGVPVVEVASREAWEEHRETVTRCDVVVDALFGTGLSRPLEGHWRVIVEDLNDADVPVVAVDLPSGLSADVPGPIGEAVEASLTVTLGAPKLPLLVPPAATLAGDVVVADIGIPEAVIERLSGPRCEVITRERASTMVVPRPDTFHKGDCGRIVVAAGSVGKTGAAALAALGALRSGAGLVTVATPAASQAVVASMAPEYMTVGLPQTSEGTVRAASAEIVLRERCDVLAVGPGLGQGDEVRAFVRALIEEATVPLVLDADALNACADEPDLLTGRPGRDLIVTPHPGEMARLCGMTVEAVQADRVEVARRFATDRSAYVVLKGARTVVATPSGVVWINVTGNPGMATGGTGDVLTGVVAAWMAQLQDAESACTLGVLLHGLAGDLATVGQGEVGLVASDLLAHLGPAVLDLLEVEDDGDGRLT